jgi:hypothetical protein
MQMPPTKLVIFGNPKTGTPLMIISPNIAIDLPLKILVWEGVDGNVWISYNAPAYRAWFACRSWSGISWSWMAWQRKRLSETSLLSGLSLYISLCGSDAACPESHRQLLSKRMPWGRGSGLRAVGKSRAPVRPFNGTFRVGASFP